MRETKLTLPEVGMIGATRGLLGAGVALLLADKVPEAKRKTVGWTLVSIGALTTVPLAFIIFGRSRRVRGIEREHGKEERRAQRGNHRNGAVRESMAH